MSGSGSNQSGSTAGSRVSGGGRSSSGSNENVVPLPPNLVVPHPLLPLPPSLSLGSSGADSNNGHSVTSSGGGGTSLSAQVGSSRQYLSQEIGSGSGSGEGSGGQAHGSSDGFHGSGSGSQVSAPTSSSEGTPAPDLPIQTIPADLLIPAIPADLPIPDEVSPPSKKPKTEHPSKAYSDGETHHEAHITFEMPHGKTTRDFVFQLSTTNITIGFKDSLPIIDKGALRFSVKPACSSWRLVGDSFISINLAKEEYGLLWNDIIDSKGGIRDADFRDMNPQPSD